MEKFLLNPSVSFALGLRAADLACEELWLGSAVLCLSAEHSWRRGKQIPRLCSSDLRVEPGWEGKCLLPGFGSVRSLGLVANELLQHRWNVEFGYR